MRNLICILLVILMIVGSITGCVKTAPQPTPPPTPPPAPAPTPTPEPAPIPETKPASKDMEEITKTEKLDEPKLSDEEVCSYVWSLIPTQLPDGHQKNQLLSNTKKAIYEGNGKWKFTVSGRVEDTISLPIEIVKTEKYWVDRETQEVTTYELRLDAEFYEETRNFEIADIEKLNERVDTKVIDTPILKKEIKLCWIRGAYDGVHYFFEGSIENIGRIPVSRLRVEIFCGDEDLNLIAVKRCPVEPEMIAAGERGHFKFDFHLYGEKLRTYDQRFTAGLDEVFQFIEETESEEKIFCYEQPIEKQKAISSGISWRFNKYVEPLNSAVRDTTLEILEGAPAKIDSNSEIWKIWKINSWVANHIIYISDPKGFDYTVYAHETLEKGAGDCEDIAILLASMYEAVGLDAMLAYIDIDDDDEAEHLSCLVYYPEDLSSFLDLEQLIIDKFEVKNPMDDLEVKFVPGAELIIPPKSSPQYEDYSAGIWIIADPIVSIVQDIVGLILYEPYNVIFVEDVGN